MSKILSGKVKKIPSTAVSADRYNFLQLSEAEPDLGIPAQSGYALTSDTSGNRSWVSRGITLTGDATGSGTNSIGITLATVNSNVGTFNSVTVNAKGLVTAASNVAYLTSYTETDTFATVTNRGSTTATAITLTNSTNSTSVSTGALVVTGGVAVNANLVVKGNLIDTTSSGAIVAAQTAVQTTVATITENQVVDTWPSATYRAAKYLIQITQGSTYQVCEVLILHNGTTTTMTEYGVLESGSTLGTLTSDLSGGNIRLLVSMASATSATINIQRTLIVV
jgi:hypothetical protein